MPASAIGLSGGILLGLASSLHCVGMCGGISLMLGQPARQGSDAVAATQDQLALHAGRMLGYTALGAAAGGFGGAVLGGFDVMSGHALLRWMAALSLGWIGLSLTGFAPAPSALGRRLMPSMSPASLLLGAPRPLGRFTAGVVWGLMPCGMLYGALLYALFAGSAVGGGLVMTGFALGTMPALLATGSAYARLRRLGRDGHGNRLLGIAVMCLAVLSLIDNGASLGRLCGSIGQRLLF